MYCSRTKCRMTRIKLHKAPPQSCTKRLKACAGGGKRDSTARYLTSQNVYCTAYSSDCFFTESWQQFAQTMSLRWKILMLKSLNLLLKQENMLEQLHTS